MLTNTRISFDKRALEGNHHVQQVYGIEFKYNNEPIVIKNFSLGCFYHLLRSAVWIFRDPDIDVYEYCSQVDRQDVILSTRANQLDLQTESITNRWCFYELQSVISQSHAIKTHLDTFGAAKHFYQNPVANTTQLNDWANSFVQPFMHNPSSASTALQIANSIDYIGQRPDGEEILNRIYQTINLVTNKIYVAAQQILVVPDPHIDLNQIQLHIVVKKVQYREISSYSIDNMSQEEWDRIEELLGDNTLIKFLQNSSSSFNHFYTLTNINEKELVSIKTHLNSEFNESDYNITRYFLACTQDCQSMLLTIIPEKFECLDNLWLFLRTCIR